MAPHNHHLHEFAIEPGGCLHCPGPRVFPLHAEPHVGGLLIAYFGTDGAPAPTANLEAAAARLSPEPSQPLYLANRPLTRATADPPGTAPAAGITLLDGAGGRSRRQVTFANARTRLRMTGIPLSVADHVRQHEKDIILWRDIRVETPRNPDLTLFP